MKISRKAMIRKWRIRKIKLSILSLIPIIIGGVLIVQGLFAPPLKDNWKLITGFIICVSGIFSMIDTYHWKFKNYLSKKMKKAR